MSDQVKCPQCGQYFGAPIAAPGTEIRCAYCGASFIPGAPQPPGQDQGFQQPPPPPPQQPHGFAQPPVNPPGQYHQGPPPPPGFPGQFGHMPPKPDNNLVWAILSTVFCCQLLGIVAIVYAAQVDGKYHSGDIAGAIHAADNAKKWCWIAFIAGLIVSALVVVGQIAAHSNMR